MGFPGSRLGINLHFLIVLSGSLPADAIRTYNYRFKSGLGLDLALGLGLGLGLELRLALWLGLELGDDTKTLATNLCSKSSKSSAYAPSGCKGLKKPKIETEY